MMRRFLLPSPQSLAPHAAGSAVKWLCVLCVLCVCVTAGGAEVRGSAVTGTQAERARAGKGMCSVRIPLFTLTSYVPLPPLPSTL